MRILYVAESVDEARHHQVFQRNRLGPYDSLYVLGQPMEEFSESVFDDVVFLCDEWKVSVGVFRDIQKLLMRGESVGC